MIHTKYSPLFFHLLPVKGIWEFVVISVLPETRGRSYWCLIILSAASLISLRSIEKCSVYLNSSKHRVDIVLTSIISVSKFKLCSDPWCWSPAQLVRISRFLEICYKCARMVFHHCYTDLAYYLNLKFLIIKS